MKTPLSAYKNVLGALYLAVVGILFCFGILDVSLPEFLNADHVSDPLIGLNGSLFCLGFVAGSLLGYYLLKSLSYVTIFRVCVFGILLLLVILGLWINPTIIFLLSFFEGIFACCIYIVFDSSAASISDHFNKRKGFLNGLYIAVTYGAYALGTSGAYYLHEMNTLDRFLLVVFIGALLCLPLAFSKKFSQLQHLFQSPPPTSQNPPPSYIKAIGYLFCLPLVLITVSIYGALDEALPELLPVYAENLGLDPGLASLVLTIFVLGSAILPPIFGYISDHLGYIRTTVVYLSLFSVCCLVLLFEMGDFFFTWPALFVMGGITSSFSALGLTLLGLRYKGVTLALACMSMELIGNICGTIMPLISGESMSLWGPRGLTLSILGLCIFGFIAYIFFLLIKPKSPISTKALPT